jgi:hypothetical protein
VPQRGRARPHDPGKGRDAASRHDPRRAGLKGADRSAVPGPGKHHRRAQRSEHAEEHSRQLAGATGANAVSGGSRSRGPERAGAFDSVPDVTGSVEPSWSIQYRYSDSTNGSRFSSQIETGNPTTVTANSAATTTHASDSQLPTKTNQTARTSSGY